jgi:hypothetical protein
MSPAKIAMTSRTTRATIGGMAVALRQSITVYGGPYILPRKPLIYILRRLHPQKGR